MVTRKSRWACLVNVMQNPSNKEVWSFHWLSKSRWGLGFLPLVSYALIYKCEYSYHTVATITHSSAGGKAAGFLTSLQLVKVKSKCIWGLAYSHGVGCIHICRDGCLKEPAVPFRQWTCPPARHGKLKFHRHWVGTRQHPCQRHNPKPPFTCAPAPRPALCWHKHVCDHAGSWLQPETHSKGGREVSCEPDLLPFCTSGPACMGEAGNRPPGLRRKVGAALHSCAGSCLLITGQNYIPPLKKS